MRWLCKHKWISSNRPLAFQELNSPQMVSHGPNSSSGKSRYGDFASSAEHIPTNILAERLKRLEAAGLIESTAYSQHPPRFEYHLTERGRALQPVLDAVASWGVEQFPGTRRLPRFRQEQPSQTTAAQPRG